MPPPSVGTPGTLGDGTLGRGHGADGVAMAGSLAAAGEAPRGLSREGGRPGAGANLLELADVRAMLLEQRAMGEKARKAREAASKATGRPFRGSDDIQWRPPSVRIHIPNPARDEPTADDAEAPEAPTQRPGPMARATAALEAHWAARTTASPTHVRSPVSSPAHSQTAASSPTRTHASVGAPLVSPVVPASQSSPAHTPSSSNGGTSASRALAAMSPEDAANILRNMPPAVAAELLIQMTVDSPAAGSTPAYQPPPYAAAPSSWSSPTASHVPSEAATESTLATTTAADSAPPAKPARALHLDPPTPAHHPASNKAATLLESSQKGELALIDAIDKLQTALSTTSLTAAKSHAPPLPKQSPPLPQQSPTQSSQVGICEGEDDDAPPPTLDGMTESGMAMLLELDAMSGSERSRYLASLSDEQRRALLDALDGGDEARVEEAKPRRRTTAAAPKRKPRRAERA